VTDDTGQTLLLIETELIGQGGGFWTEPIDFQVQSLQVRGYAQLGGVLDGGFSVATVDGRGHFISEATDPILLEALITANGGERLSDDVLD
jgi:hypothetical protein